MFYIVLNNVNTLELIVSQDYTPATEYFLQQNTKHTLSEGPGGAQN
jgi:hypothetical protein